MFQIAARLSASGRSRSTSFASSTTICSTCSAFNCSGPLSRNAQKRDTREFRRIVILRAANARRHYDESCCSGAAVRWECAFRPQFAVPNTVINRCGGCFSTGSEVNRRRSRVVACFSHFGQSHRVIRCCHDGQHARVGVPCRCDRTDRGDRNALPRHPLPTWWDDASCVRLLGLRALRVSPSRSGAPPHRT